MAQKSILICFRVVQHPKAGRNTQHTSFVNNYFVENDGGQQLGSSLGRLRDHGQRHNHLLRQNRNTHH